MTETNDRLDSWKAIADYLNRDIRTLRRWELQGLPVRRVGAGRGNSVFAFRDEIDEWLRSGGPDRPVASAAVLAVAPTPHAPTPPPAVRSGAWISRLPRRSIAAGVVFAVIFFGWRTFAPNAAPQQLDVKVTDSAVIAESPNGKELWRFDFPMDVRNVPGRLTGAARVLTGQRPAIFTITSYQMTLPNNVPLGGLLRQFSPQGKLQGTFEFNDRWTFGGTSYGGPWAITDAQINDAFGRRQIAVAAHHYRWWPGVVTILDERLQRLSTFVNSGWIDGLGWISPDRLAIVGFNEALNGGMFGVLDTHDVDGASPEAPGTTFTCDDCRSGRPLYYFVFPRSELNRVTGSRFNRAFVETTPNGVTIRADEVAREDGSGPLVEAVYEFSTGLALLRASYGDRYWDKHHSLELEGKITHTRAECPERDGPPLVKTWTKETGWRDVRPPR